MLINVPLFQAPNYQGLNRKTVFLILFSIAFFVRFPFFFRDYIDRDESTFIIMAQSWVDGNLPYTQLWDLKPPITFLFFAAVISVFGKSFMAIRLFGTLLVTATALCTYEIGRTVASVKVGFWCAVFCVLFQSMFGSLQGVMSEHICTLFFILGVYLLLRKERGIWYFVAGMFFGLSAMSKLNMAYPLLALGIYLTREACAGNKFWHDFQRLIAMGIGFALLVALTALPYHVQGEICTWWQSIFEAPLAYSRSKYHSWIKTLPFVLAAFGSLFLGFASKIIDFKSRQIQVFTVITIGVLLSFVQAGKINGHYLIQLYPFILVPAGMALGKLPPIGKKFSNVVCLLLLLLPVEAYLEYANIISNKMEKGSFFNGEGIDVPNYIVENNIETKNIFFTEYHIGYWVLGEDPPTKAATHPSNITREELFPFMDNARSNAMQELRYILEEIRPKTIVTQKGKGFFDNRLIVLNKYMGAYLEKHYTLAKTIDRALVYQRLE